MKDQEITYKAIIRAIIGGYLVPEKAYNYEVFVPEDLEDITIIWDFYQDRKNDAGSIERIECEPDCCGKNKDKTYSVYDIIFDPEFSKALWGKYGRLDYNKGLWKDREYCDFKSNLDFTISYWWEVKHKHIVKSKNPIKYLEKFV